MPFVLEKVPGQIVAYEAHQNGSGSRDKKVQLRLNVTDSRFIATLDDTFAGFDLMTKDMAGRDAPGMTLVCSRRLDEVTVKFSAMQDAFASEPTEVFAMGMAKPKGKPTLRIGRAALTVEMVMSVVGSMARDQVAKLDELVGADVFIDVAVLQSDLEDVPGVSSRGKKRRREKATIVLEQIGAGERIAEQPELV